MNTEDAKHHNEESSEEDSFDDGFMMKDEKEAMAKIEDLGDMKAEDKFEVYQRMNSKDFQKFLMKSIIPID